MGAGKLSRSRIRSGSLANSIVHASAFQSASQHIAPLTIPTFRGRIFQQRRQGTLRSMATSSVKKQQKYLAQHNCFFWVACVLELTRLWCSHITLALCFFQTRTWSTAVSPLVHNSL